MKLKDWRTANRYSQSAFGKLLKDILGKAVSQQAVAAWEDGRAAPTLAKAEAIKKVTGGKVRPESFIEQA
jgi:transcriptional regulator with XRE-family HTH domain